jgi:hypothetical protein
MRKKRRGVCTFGLSTCTMATLKPECEEGEADGGLTTEAIPHHHNSWVEEHESESVICMPQYITTSSWHAQSIS